MEEVKGHSKENDRVIENKIAFQQITPFEVVQILKLGKEEWGDYLFVLLSTGDLGKLQNYRVDLKILFERTWFKRVITTKETNRKEEKTNV